MIVSASRRGRGRHVTPLVAVLLLLTLVAGCSDDTGSEPDEEAPASAAADPATEAAVLETWEAYWSAVVEAENTAEAEGPAVARLAEVAAPPIVEGHLAVIRRYERYGLRRVGEPELRDVEIEVDGSTARVTACISEDGWGAEVEGEPIEEKVHGFHPTAATLERTDGTWQVTERDRRASVRC